MDDGGERPGGAERAKNNLLTTDEFYYFIIDVEIQIRVVTSDRRPPHQPFDIERHYHRIGRNRGRSGGAVSRAHIAHLFFRGRAGQDAPRHGRRARCGRRR